MRNTIKLRKIIGICKFIKLQKIVKKRNVINYA